MSTRIRTPRGKRESAASTSMDHPEPMIIQEEIVMTPLKAKAGSQMIRVERVSSGILDEKKVHYSAEGPYKGIVVNKATNVKRKKKEPETVRRLIAYVHDEGETTKEVREIRFWFKPETNSGAMEDYSDEFFRELIDPKNFPKDHLQFVKRLLTLVQKYSPLKSVELEMRPHTANDDDDPFWTEARQRRRLRKATSAAAAVDAPGPRPVRQSTSTDDLLHGGRRRRRVRRLTVGGTDPPPPQPPPTDRRDPATVFVYKRANDGGEEKRSEEKTEEEEKEKKERKKKKKGKGSGSESGNNPDLLLRLRSGGGSENLNGVGIDDSDVFGHSDETQHISDVKLKKRGGLALTSTPTEPNGNTPNNVKESKTSVYPIPIYGVVKKNRTTSLEAASSPSELETVVLTRSPRGPSRSGHHGQSPPPPLPVEKRRSTGSGGRRRPKSSASLTATGAVTPPPTTPVGESRTGSEDAPEKEPPTTAAVNGRRSSGRRARKDRRRPPEEEEESSAMTSEAGAKVVGLLEDAFPSMLPVDDLIRMSKMAPDAVESALRMLQAAGMAVEAESGFWVRSQVPRRIKPSSPGGNNSSGQEATDLYRNEFRMVASVPSLAAEDQPTIAIITSMYCEKQAVDTMMDVKKTYVRYKAKGEGLVYTVGLIDRHRIVSTKLSRAGPGSETTKWSAENTVPRLLEAFGQIEHVLLVGVGGGVANDDGDRVCLGDVVVSKATDRTDGYVYFHVTGSGDRDQSITLETRPWSTVDSELQSVVAKMEKSPKKLWRQMDAFIAEATAAAAAAATSGDLDGTRFARPPATHSDGAGARERRTSPYRPAVHFGPVAAGKILTRDGAVRTQFCLRQGVKAVDAGFQRVLDSLEETRSGAQPPSYLVVRGVADYGDGTKAKEWQPYAALAAAAVMKCVVMRLSLPGDDEGVV